MTLTQHDAARLMADLDVRRRDGRHTGLLSCPHVTFTRGERKMTAPLWDPGRRLPISGHLDWSIGMLCLPCAEIYRKRTGQ